MLNIPQNLHLITDAEAEALCAQLRQRLVEVVSRQGGHLASNLGAVELTVALHRVFSPERDRIVFDVGHQCYCHKMLTGRNEAMEALRTFGRISGFPKPGESVCDAFTVGHASTAVSAAVGMARARTLLGKDYHVVALLGDGALTGGLAYEGLSDAGDSGERLLVILNDNGMSITQSVGGVAEHLARQRLKPQYLSFKKGYRRVMQAFSLGRHIYKVTHKIKTAVKETLLPCSLFEDMGFTYLGPVDGHDLDRLCHVLEWARELACPVVVHVHTVKGKGYPYAEQNPEKFHGVSPFDPETGLALQHGGESFSAEFGRTLVTCGAEDSRVCAVTAAMADGTGLSGFAREFPERFFDVAIAEGHGAAMAAGLAKQGMIPVFAVYSTFLQRSYDMLIHDVALQGLHVVLGVDRAGLVGADGETHHGCLDPLFLSEIPGFTVLCPANFAELRSMIRQALFQCGGPVAVRYPRGGEGAFRQDTSDKAAVCLREGGDVTMLSYGILVNHLLEAAKLLEKDGIQAQIVKLNRISPLAYEDISPFFAVSGTVLVLEDAFGDGCVGQRISSLLAEHGKAPRRLILKNLGRAFAPEGSVGQLERRFGLDPAGVAEAVKEAFGQER